MQRHRDRLEQSPSSLARVRVSRFCSDFVSCFLLFRFLFPLLLLLFACHFTCHLCGLSPSYSPFHMSSLWSFPFLHSISYVISVAYPLPTVPEHHALDGSSPSVSWRGPIAVSFPGVSRPVPIAVSVAGCHAMNFC